MTTFANSFASTNDFSTYWSNFFINIFQSGQLPVNDWDCTYGNPNWTTCLQTYWQWPVLFMVMNALKGIFWQSTSHWGFFATTGAPEVEDSFISGIHNVYTAWYIADSQINAYYTTIASIVVPTFAILNGGLMIHFNHDSSANTYTQPYFTFGILQVIAGAIYICTSAVVLGYDVINSVYLQSRYDPVDYVTIKFGTWTNVFGANNETQENGWLATLVYLEQIFIGNKRMSLYANIMMAAAMSLHPITLPFSLFFYSQLPWQLILDLIVYPIWPQFDTPQLPWYEFFN